MGGEGGGASEVQAKGGLMPKTMTPQALPWLPCDNQTLSDGASIFNNLEFSRKGRRIKNCHTDPGDSCRSDRVDKCVLHHPSEMGT